MKNMQTESQNQVRSGTDSAPRKPRASNGANKALLVLIVILIGAGFYFYRQYAALKANPATADAEREVISLVAEVSKYMILPDETPTVATVTDVTKLQDQAFFAKAKNGDKVLIFTQAKKAILFDPVAKKIVEVAPINIGDSQTRATPKPAPAPVTPDPIEEETLDTTSTP